MPPDDHAFRVIAVAMTTSNREVLKTQRLRGAAAKALVELCTSAVLLRETMAPDLRVQGIVRSAAGGCTLVGDAFPDGSVRGLAQVKSGVALSPDHPFSLSKGSLLQMMRSLVNGSLQQGIVDVGDAGGLGEALTTYFIESEQLACVARVGSKFQGDELIAAGGFVVQLLPEVERPIGMIMTQRLEDFPPIESFLEREDFSAELLIEELLHGMPHTELARGPLSYFCRCSETLVLSALSALGRDDIQSMIDDGDGLEIHCDYCGKDYAVAVERLRALLTES